MVDSHCHLAGEEFAADLDAVAGRAAASGVTTALCILAAEDEAEVGRAEVVRAAWPSMRFATGIHPHHAGQFGGETGRALTVVRAALEASGACAIGEIGLDYHYDFSPRDAQHEVFRAQLRLARERNLPVVLHTREATDDTFRILEEEGGRAMRGVFHCFTGDAAMARRALALDFYVSFAGILTFPKAVELREAARVVPIDRLLSETDAPYLAPVPFRGQRNEPAYVTRVVDTLADLHAQPPAAMAVQLAENFASLFVRAVAPGEAPRASGPHRS